jgi:hypothetical protein
MAESITNATTKSKVIIDGLGFSVVNGNQTIIRVPWIHVQAIYGYTRFVNQVGTLCLDFMLPEDDEGDAPRIIVEEGADGWSMLNTTLEQVFPSLDRRWSDKAADDGKVVLGKIVPKYISNLTQVWKR